MSVSLGKIMVSSVTIFAEVIVIQGENKFYMNIVSGLEIQAYGNTQDII